MPRPKRRKPATHPSKPHTALRPAYLALLLALAGIPALFNIHSGASFEPDKAAVLILLAAVAGADLLLGAASRGPRPRPRIMRQPAQALLAGLAAWAMLITLTSIDPVTSLWGNYYRAYGLLTLLAGLIFLLTARQMTQAGLHWLLIDAILLGAVIPLTYGLLQLLSLDPVRGMGVSFPLGQRASSTLGNPLYLGDYLLLTLFLALPRRLLHPPAAKLPRRILEIFILLLLLLLGLTFSRSAYLGLLIAASVALILWRMKRRAGPARLASSSLVLLAGAAALLLGSALLVWLWPRLQHGGTLQQRWLIWQAALNLMRSRPRAWLLGLGFDTLPLALAPHLSPTLAHFEPDFIFRIPDRAHAWPLDALVAGGVPWLLGWLVLGLLALTRLLRSKHALAPWLAALLLGRATLLLVSFPTHAPDLLGWAILGMALGLSAQKTISPAPAVTLDALVVMAAWMAAFGFIAAWPGGLFLWLMALPLLIALRHALAPESTLALTSPLFYAALPAILLNQHGGMGSWLAWILLMVWIVAMAWQQWPQHRAGWQMALIAVMLVLITGPRLGDIAYKTALLSSHTDEREQALAAALRLAPYDHIMAAGVAWSNTQRAATQPHARESRTAAISQLYERAMQAQPLAPEPAAAYARWLSDQQASHADAAFEHALSLSPHDIQLLNDRAIFWAATGRSAAAIDELERLLMLAPRYGPTYRHLAQLYREIGDPAAADAVEQQGRAQTPWWTFWNAKNAPE
jgi:tetratricopeptide (TPR) repeat protein